MSSDGRRLTYMASKPAFNATAARGGRDYTSDSERLNARPGGGGERYSIQLAMAPAAGRRGRQRQGEAITVVTGG